MTKIFIATTHSIICVGLKELLKREYQISGLETNGISAYNFIIKNEPCIAILDVDLAILSGLEIVSKCKREKISTKIILTTFHKEAGFYFKKRYCNIYGYLLKESSVKDIQECVASVSKGRPFLHKRKEDYFEFNEKIDNVLELLTASELRILKLVADNNTSVEIANILSLSSRTVDKHRSNIILKLELSSNYRSLNTWAKTNKHLLKVL